PAVLPGRGDPVAIRRCRPPLHRAPADAGDQRFCRGARWRVCGAALSLGDEPDDPGFRRLRIGGARRRARDGAAVGVWGWAGAVRPARLDAVRRLDGGLEPAGVADHDRLLPRCAAARRPAAWRRTQRIAWGGMTGERPPYLPGDRVPEAEIEEMIRVDHAGE